MKEWRSSPEQGFVYGLDSVHLTHAHRDSQICHGVKEEWLGLATASVWGNIWVQWTQAHLEQVNFCVHLVVKGSGVRKPGFELHPGIAESVTLDKLLNVSRTGLPIYKAGNDPSVHLVGCCVRLNEEIYLKHLEYHLTCSRGSIIISLPNYLESW